LPDHVDATAGDGSVLERLVADFLATEQSPVRRLNETHASAEHGSGVPAVRGQPHVPSTTLPAVRGSRVPARSRLLERAPEVQRGAVRLLGSSKARRLEHDRPALLEAAKPRALPGVAPQAAPAAAPGTDAHDDAEPIAAAAVERATHPPERKLFFPFMIG
jgi:hypothetical protein